MQTTDAATPPDPAPTAAVTPAAPPRVAATAPLLLPVAFLAFVSIGLPDSILGVAWPSIRQTFGLPVSQLGALLLSGMVGYLLSTFYSGTIVARLGVGRLLLCSGLLIVASSLGYALAPAWWVMVCFGVVSGLGAGAIDAGLNAFAAKHFTPRVMNWMHAFYGVGAMTGPLLATALLVRGWSWRWGYGGVAMMLAAMSVLFLLTLKLWEDHDRSDGSADAAAAAASRAGPDAADPPAGIALALRHPMVWLHVALFFAYAGVEATAGQWAFSLFTEGRGIRADRAGTAVGLYWGSLAAGRLVIGYLAGHFAADAILRATMLIAPLVIGVIWLNVSTAVSLIALSVLGFVLAPMFPLLVSRTPARVGHRLAAHAIGFEVAAAYLGIAGGPAMTGVLARRSSLEVLNPVLMTCAIAVLVLHELVLRRSRNLSAPPASNASP